MKHLDPDRHCVIDCFAGRGAGELIGVVDRVTANDTSFGVAHWPLSSLEQTVFETTQFINLELPAQLPVGEDVKVMGCRQGGDILLTVALPFIAPRLRNAAEYLEARREAAADILAFATRAAPRHQVRVMVNTADNPDSDSYYLTLTGTSAEMGDDGAVGRGNRVNGLITPFRPASLEAASGKNPVSHVGKIYNLMALEAARAIVAGVPDIQEAQVYILSQIGHSLDQPLVAAAVVRPAGSALLPRQIEGARRVVAENLQALPDIRAGLRAGTLPTF
jgi:S-adenosylmethionine synthetase